MRAPRTARLLSLAFALSRAAAAAPDAPSPGRDDAKPAAGAAEAKSTPGSAEAKPGAGSPEAKPETEPAKAPAAPRAAEVGPGSGAGDRKVRTPEAAPERAAEPKPEPAQSAAATKGHKAGRAPKSPKPTLPEGVPPPAPDAEARRQIVGGPTTDEVTSGKNDPELRALSAAERVLFARPLRGARAGFSWDLPAPVDEGGATVEASGLPPSGAWSAASMSDPAKEAVWLRSLVLPSLPTRLDARVVKYLKFYRDDQRGKNILRTWAKKCGRFVPALKAEFARVGLSTDLVWLSLIESGHNPMIQSPAGAAGLWQFIPESARLYGLTVDRWVDERLDPARSTEAATRYLHDLRARFGTWELAMAAYNMGHGALLRSVRRFNTNDFWTLSRYEAGLPWETTLYVPKILATAIAMNNPKVFGIDDVQPDPPISFDTVSVGPGTDLADVARAAEASVEDIRALNGQYLTGRTPPAAVASGPFRIRVPSGRALVTQQRLADARKVGPKAEPHVVRFGDTVETIAAEYGATAAEIVAQNRVAPDERLRAGSVLLVPARAAAAVSDTPEEVVVVPARHFAESSRARVFYRVLPGDRLGEIAAAFGVAPSELALWNALDESASLQQGMTLQVFVKDDADLSRVRCLRAHEVRVLVAGTEEFTEYFEALNGRKRVVVTAKKGDTLASIGRKYGMTTGMMERINRMSSQTAIVPGQRIVAYSKGDAPAEPSRDLAAAQVLSSVVAPAPDALPPMPRASTDPNGPRAVSP